MATRQRPLPSYLIYEDAQGHWRWNLAAANGKVIAASTVGYAQKQRCVRAVQAIKNSAKVPVLAVRKLTDPNEPPPQPLPAPQGIFATGADAAAANAAAKPRAGAAAKVGPGAAGAGAAAKPAKTKAAAPKSGTAVKGKAGK